MITLAIQPATPPLSWDAFCGSAPAYAIALDGYVHGGPRFDAAGPRANFNHHEDVDRLATRATCAQVHVAIRQGLFAAYRTSADGACAFVYANDCDQDVCLSWWLLKNHHRAEPTMNAALNRLVGMEDMLDATAGAYPYPVDLPALHEVAWIFAPYARARAAGMLDGRDPGVFMGVVEDVCSRIDRHVIGGGGSMPLDTRYDRISTGHGWAMVSETGAHARTGMFADGVRAFVSAKPRANGRWNYVVGRMSRFIPFDVPRILAALNEAEGIDGADRWGGGDTIGGSPRVAGSVLDPETVARVVERVTA